MADRIVSIGLLTQQDLDRLGQGFDRHFSVTQDNPFSDLIAKVDNITCDDAARSPRTISGVQRRDNRLNCTLSAKRGWK